MAVHREAGLWVAPFPVANLLHIFEVDALRSAEGVGGWLNEAAVCTAATLGVGAKLATKEQAFVDPMCTRCWIWLLEHQYANLMYSRPGEPGIAEPSGVGLEDLRAQGWRGDA